MFKGGRRLEYAFYIRNKIGKNLVKTIVNIDFDFFRQINQELLMKTLAGYGQTILVFITLKLQHRPATALSKCSRYFYMLIKYVLSNL